MQHMQSRTNLEFLAALLALDYSTVDPTSGVGLVLAFLGLDHRRKDPMFVMRPYHQVSKTDYEDATRERPEVSAFPMKIIFPIALDMRDLIKVDLNEVNRIIQHLTPGVKLCGDELDLYARTVCAPAILFQLPDLAMVELRSKHFHDVEAFNWRVEHTVGFERRLSRVPPPKFPEDVQG